jgi:cytochrome c peroxidase
MLTSIYPSFIQLVKQNWSPKIVNGQTQFKDDADELMMLPADLALIKDPKFREIVDIYAKDKKAFFDDFASAFGKLLELGVNRGELAKL